LVIIDEPTCTHCDLCIPACPVHALFFDKTEQTTFPSEVKNK
jgi:NAD-dependent dihydropyrimidine dehydrogenase PreA subunit